MNVIKLIDSPEKIEVAPKVLDESAKSQIFHIFLDRFSIYYATMGPQGPGLGPGAAPPSPTPHRALGGTIYRKYIEIY